MPPIAEKVEDITAVQEVESRRKLRKSTSQIVVGSHTIQAKVKQGTKVGQTSITLVATRVSEEAEGCRSDLRSKNLKDS